MSIKNIYNKTYRIAMLAVIGIFLSSCEKYVDIAIAPSSLATADVYKSDASATSAVTALYSYFYTTNYITNDTFLGGLYSDELQYTSSTSPIIEFSQSAVTTTNSSSASFLWSYAYYIIGEANLAIDGITNSSTITTGTKNQLIGEAKFFRAFMYLNLVNYFGDVPLTITADQVGSAFAARTPVATVQAQIIADLNDAVNKLPTAYVGISAQKARVNKYAAAALLARVYLYNKDYVNAEAQSTIVIGSGTYSLSALSNAFISTSTETILQFSNTTGASAFGSGYRTSTSTATSAPPTYCLSPVIATAFQAGDLRKTSWVDSTTYNAVKYYRINKYKVVSATAAAPGNEYNVVLRLAEQYLIRAEARAQQGNISGAQADINTIRTRAGLANTTAATMPALLTAVATERKFELFGEFSHRWFDLNRTGQANAVIGALKPSTWKPTAVLLPIPTAQILLNPNLTQNPGY